MKPSGPIQPSCGKLSAPRARCTRSGECKITISLERAHGRHTLLASQHFTVRAGATSTLKVHLNSTGVHLLTSGHGRFSSILTIVLHPPGAASHTVTAHVTINH
jgi:hypothetical protein